MRRWYKRRVIVAFLIVLLVVLLAWWIGEGIYKPYPPATPTVTPGYWPTRVTATIVPSATPTKIVHTPIQPTIGYTITPTVFATSENTATATPQPTETITPMPLVYPIQKSIEYECVTYFIRPWGVKKINRCWHPEERKLTTPIPCWDCVIWWPPITTPPYTSVPFTGSPIFTP